jgi:ubiquinone/menaquinone biosynthesis C-methylase UbiE
MNRTQKAAARYVGQAAAGYDAKRRDKPMWRREEEVLRSLLRPEPGLQLLDCPVGTGRFLPLWTKYGYAVTGIDISPDMVSQAIAAIPDGANVVLRTGSIFQIAAPDASFDVAVAIRIITLIEEADMVRALRELQRVTTREIIFNTRVGVRRNAQRIDVIKDSLRRDWRIAGDVEIHEPSFRMIRLARV